MLAVGGVTLGLKAGMAEVLYAQMCTLDFCVRDFDIKVSSGIPYVDASHVKYRTKFRSPNTPFYDICWTAAKEPFKPALLIRTNAIVDNSTG